jgi:chitodextrinase
MSVQNDVMVEHSSVESVNSAHTQSGLSGSSSLTVNPEATPPSRLESTSMQQNHKKVIDKIHIWK